MVQNIEGGTPDGDTPDGSAYHGYWAQDIYAINTHFGGAEDLVKLSQSLHSRGMVSLLLYSLCEEETQSSKLEVLWLMLKIPST